MNIREKAAAYDRLIQERRDYASGWRDKRRAYVRAGLIPIQHGTSLGYNLYDCRCLDCKHYKSSHRGAA